MAEPTEHPATEHRATGHGPSELPPREQGLSEHRRTDGAGQAAAAADEHGSPRHRRIDAVAERLRELGATGELRVLPEAVRTARQAADALGCPVGAIANSLVFDADGKPVLILTSGAHRVDTAKVSATLGVTELNRASPEFVRLHTGQPIGGVAPVGHPEDVPTFLDTSLAGYPMIWAAAGHPHAVFQSSYDELCRLTNATEIDVD